jgi:hypothetical protein
MLGDSTCPVGPEFNPEMKTPSPPFCCLSKILTLAGTVHPRNTGGKNDPLCCPRCSGKMKVISVMEDENIAKKILKHPPP